MHCHTFRNACSLENSMPRMVISPARCWSLKVTCHNHAMISTWSINFHAAGLLFEAHHQSPKQASKPTQSKQSLSLSLSLSLCLRLFIIAGVSLALWPWTSRVDKMQHCACDVWQRPGIELHSGCYKVRGLCRVLSNFMHQSSGRQRAYVNARQGG